MSFVNRTKSTAELKTAGQSFLNGMQFAVRYGFIKLYSEDELKL